MFIGCKHAPFGPFEPGDRWHLSVLPTLVLARSANDAGASTAAQLGRTKGTAQLVLRTQARRKEKGRPSDINLRKAHHMLEGRVECGVTGRARRGESKWNALKWRWRG